MYDRLVGEACCGVCGAAQSTRHLTPGTPHPTGRCHRFCRQWPARLAIKAPTKVVSCGVALAVPKETGRPEPSAIAMILPPLPPLLVTLKLLSTKHSSRTPRRWLWSGYFVPLIRCERSRSGAISDKGNITQGYQKLADWNADSFSTEGSPKQPRREVAHTGPPPEPDGASV